MSSELQVIAQCQRCGRGFITISPSVVRDPYGNPTARGHPKPLCDGAILPLAEPVGIKQFENYGPLLPIAAALAAPPVGGM